MNARTVTRLFPHSEATIVLQTGAQLGTPTTGVQIIFHIRENEKDPCCAEVISGEHHAEIGLWFEGNELGGFDGAFFLPREIGTLLIEAGYVVPDELFA